MIFRVKATIDKGRDYHTCYTEASVYVEAGCEGEAKLKGIKYISDNSALFDGEEILAYSIFCMHRSSFEEFLEFCTTSNTGSEKNVREHCVRTFWDSISSLQKLESLWDYETHYALEYGEDNPYFEKSTDQSILDCFYAFPAKMQNVLLPEMVYVEQISLNVVQYDSEDYYVS